MSGRRRHERFAVSEPWDGALRVLRDVLVVEDHPGILKAIGHVPAVAGEHMTLEVAGAGAVATLRVRVVESRPIVLDGAVRHELLLAVLDGARRAECEGA